MLPRTLLDDATRKHLSLNNELGCGNFLPIAVATNPNATLPIFQMNEPVKTILGSYDDLSLIDFKEISDAYAAFFHGNGIRAKDPVAVYINEGVLNLIQYTALTSIGAIPALINGNMKPAIAAGFIKKIGAVALFSDASHVEAVSKELAGHPLRFIATNENASEMSEPSLPSRFPFHHVDNDPVLIGHSSGTTGIPKAVVFHHQQFFYGIRYRLSLPFPMGSERMLSALPHSHSAGIAYAMLAMLNGCSSMVLTSNRPEIVLSSIESYRPTMVVAFPETYVEMCEHDFSKYDMSSIRLWFNGGDAAHERHIRKLLSVGTLTRDGKTQTGSVFIDGLGSSEMGFSLFRSVHVPGSDTYNRCIGTPLDFVDAQVLGENGEKLPPYQVGRLGIKSPTITPGYWNDSVLTSRSQLQGYFLTGDLFYHDEKGRFFHVDRVPDAIRTSRGMLYSLQTEELVMKHFAEVSDCTIVGVSANGHGAEGIILVRLRPGMETSETELLARINAMLTTEGRLTLKKLLFKRPTEIPLGPTGKVLKRELRDQYAQTVQ